MGQGKWKGVMKGMNALPPAEDCRDSTLAAEAVGRDASLTLRPEAAHDEKLRTISEEAAALTMPFAESNEEEGYAGKHSFIDASQKQLVRQVFLFFKELTVPNTSACLLVPDWPNARFNHYLKGAQLLRSYPGGEIHKYPTKLVYLRSKDASISALSEDSSSRLTMTFVGTASGYPAIISADSQASHIFVSPDWCKRANVHVTPVSDQVLVGDGRPAPIIGRCSLRLNLGCFAERVNGLVLQGFGSHHDIIVGEEFLAPYKAEMCYASKTLKLKKGKRKFTIRSCADGPGNPIPSPSSQPIVLTALQAKRALRKGVEDAFIVLVRDPSAALDPEGELNDPLVSLNPSESSGRESEKHIADGPCDRGKLRALLQKYAHISPPELPAGLPPDRGIGTQHLINLIEGAQPPARRSYRLSPREKAEVEDHVAKLLAKGLAQPSNSPYGAPILFVPKPDGSLRMVVDYRSLNKLTVKDKYPIPRIDDLIDHLRGAKVFSALDLTQGYYQLRIAPEDVHKTAFTTPIGLYEYKVLPMGLSNSVSYFQRAMNTIFAPYLGKFMCVYLDDILIYSRSPAEHLQHLETVFKVLAEKKLYIRMHKCTFNATEVKFLGHIVGNDQVKPDPKKVEAVKNWPVPLTVHQLRAFLGLVNYFSKFIDKHARMARPLTELLKKGVPFDMQTPERLEAFKDLKSALTEAPLLTIADMSKPFKLICDASRYDISGILLQEGKPVAYESRTLKPAESNYPTHDREMLAAIHCLRIWRCYLDGSKFQLHTDHKPLLLFEDQPQLNSRQVRWMQFLALFDFEWHYTKGKENPADFLTRMPLLNALTRAQAAKTTPSGGEEGRSKAPKRSRHAGESTATPDAAAAAPQKKQRNARAANTATADAGPRKTSPAVAEAAVPSLPSPSLSVANLEAAIATDSWFADKRNLLSLQYKDGLYYLNGTLVIPNDAKLKRALIAEHHDPPARGHPGAERLVQHLLRHYWWPGITKDVKNYVATCDACQHNKSKPVKPGGLLQPMPIPSGKWESVGMDFITGLPCSSTGHDSVLVVIDRLSKLVHLVPTTTTVTAAEVAKLFVQNVIRLHGVPKSIVSDRDKNFTSIFWQTVCEMLQMDRRMSTAFHPQTDGQTERVNRVLEEYLRSYVSPLQDDWEVFLPLAEFAINDSYHTSIGMSPFYMTYGYHPRMPDTFDLPSRENPAGQQYVESITKAVKRARALLKEAQARQKQHADHKRREVSFEPGELVLLSTVNLRMRTPGSQKLLPRYVGPFAVEKQVGTSAYKLKLPSAMRVHPVFHVSLLHAYKADGSVIPPPPIFFQEGAPFYEVEEVLSHKEVRSGKRKVKKYLIKWAGYGPEHNTWEPQSNLNAAALKSYWNRARADDA